MMNLSARMPSVVSSSTLLSPGKRCYGKQDPWKSVVEDDRSRQPDKLSSTDDREKRRERTRREKKQDKMKKRDNIKRRDRMKKKRENEEKRKEGKDDFSKKKKFQDPQTRQMN